ncbi:MAG: outer membrane beta-barrel protein [Pseudomonadota bacterium]
MRKVLIPILAVLLLCAGPALARQSKYKETYKTDRHFYLSAGGSFLFERFSIDQLTNASDPYGLKLEFDNTYGFMGKAGFRYNDVWSGEGELNWFNKVDWSGKDPNAPGTTANVELEMGTATACVKLHPPIGSIRFFRPYVLAGGGLMRAKITSVVPAGGNRYNGANEEIDPVIRGGGGADFFLTDWMALGVEISYYMGFHDLNEIQYVNTTSFLSLYF